MNKIIKDTQFNIIGSGKRVLAGGCFDILHPAHLEFLQKAKEAGEKLIILLESDENIRKLKGKNRPVNNQNTRAENLSNTGLVDFIMLLQPPVNSEYYYNLVKLLRPDIIAVTKDDPLLTVKKEQAKMVGGMVKEVMIRDLRYSTSKLAENNNL
ncbi:MAG: adenylyltransferase/cytidyltransferase family protein [Candidatus Levybacteria bacterium]|nr:adenylyltransferase/cytidyltransferase family protein [Candidatus Levybacteria bacterium]